MKRSIGLLVSLMAIFAGAASAGTGVVTVTYSSIVSSTPAPSTWMLMGLGLLLAFFVYRKGHSLPGGRTMAAILMLVGVSAYELFTGSSALTKASATIQVVVESLTGGGTLTFNLTDNGTEGQVVNNTGSSITINSVTLGQNSSNGDILSGMTPDSPTCAQGVQLAVGASCYVQVFID